MDLDVIEVPPAATMTDEVGASDERFLRGRFGLRRGPVGRLYVHLRGLGVCAGQLGMFLSTEKGTASVVMGNKVLCHSGTDEKLW